MIRHDWGVAGMNDFVAIDFETANNDRSSACAIGIAVVRQGIVTETYSSLIRPPSSMEFRRDFTENIHGITPEMVADAPTFADIWPEIQRYCGDGIVAAHNATFDVGVIAACTAHYNLPHLPGRSLCTLRLARHLLPRLPNHQLPTLAAHYGIPLNHHEATSDAVACAEIAIRLFGLAAPTALDSFSQRFV